MRPARLVSIVSAGLLAVCAGARAAHAVDAAYEALLKKAKVHERTVSGTITSVTKRGISVEYSRGENESTEMLLPVEGDVAMQGAKKSLRELKPGDEVRVTYEQAVKDGDENPPMVLKTVVKQVAFVRSAPQGALVSQPAPASADDEE